MGKHRFTVIAIGLSAGAVFGASPQGCGMAFARRNALHFLSESTRA